MKSPLILAQEIEKGCGEFRPFTREGWGVIKCGEGKYYCKICKAKAQTLLDVCEFIEDESDLRIALKNNSDLREEIEKAEEICRKVLK